MQININPTTHHLLEYVRQQTSQVLMKLPVCWVRTFPRSFSTLERQAFPTSPCFSPCATLDPTTGAHASRTHDGVVQSAPYPYGWEVPKEMCCSSPGKRGHTCNSKPEQESWKSRGFLQFYIRSSIPSSCSTSSRQTSLCNGIWHLERSFSRSCPRYCAS